MLRSAYNTIKKYNMLSENDRVVVGFSGGADSVMLMLLLCELKDEMKLSIFPVHVNHGLRGKDADDDERYVEAFCKERGLQLKVFHYNVADLAKENSLSEEEMGRKLRYEAFEEVAKEVSATKIATAHHANDNCETVLHNILRGSGTTGLCGIHPVRNRYIRPLIETQRSEIEEYLTSENITWRTDKTNGEACYTRNKIRLELLPYLRENYNTSIDQAITRLSLLCREDDDYMYSETEKAFERCCSVRDKSLILLDKEAFSSLHGALRRRLIRYVLERLSIPLKDVHLVHIDDCIRLITCSQSGAKMNIGRCSVSVIQSGVLFSDGNTAENEYSYELEENGSIYIAETGETVTISETDSYIRSDKNVIFISGDGIKFPLTVRNRRQGDRITPFGMSGSKKLKDYFIDNKVDIIRRNRIPLIVNNNEVIWIAGMCLSEKYRITGTTSKIYRIEIKKSN